MACLGKPICTLTGITQPRIKFQPNKSYKRLGFRRLGLGLNRVVCCTNPTPWQPSTITFDPVKDSDGKLLKEATSIFDTLSTNESTEDSLTKNEEIAKEAVKEQPSFQYLRWPLWLFGPGMLLVTGMVPTLWLPLSSIFLGPNIASLLALTGLDCIFNLGAFLFLLMADSTARFSKNTTKPPSGYQFWNMVANITGVIVPLVVLFGSHKGYLYLQPQLPFISSAVLLGPYFLLLSVQILTEMLTWHWQSPVWLVTPVVYEGYRLLQMMRGLKLGVEVSAPAWMMHTIRGLVCWWVLVLGVQLMRVAWYAGFTTKRQSISVANND